MTNYDYNTEDRKSQVIEQLPVLLTPKDVMDILGVGKNTVYRLLNSGVLPAIRFGKSWKIPVGSIQTLVNMSHR